MLCYNHKLWYNYICARTFTKVTKSSLAFMLLARLFQKQCLHRRAQARGWRLVWVGAGPSSPHSQATTPSHCSPSTLGKWFLKPVMEKVLESRTVDQISKLIQRLGDLGYRLTLKCEGSFQGSPYAAKPFLLFAPLNYTPSNLCVLKNNYQGNDI